MCPVREADYLEGWKHNMIHSKSGLVELGCVFSTPNDQLEDTIWTVSQYDPKSFIIEFIRVTSGVELVTISIFMRPLDSTRAEALIRYVHTPLTEARETYLQTQHEGNFNADLNYWEAALNHYLATGTLLKK